MTQNWNLFAPDPVSEERGILARVACESGRPSRFIDVTSPAVADVQQQRFFPSRESRIVSNGILERFRTDDVTERLEKKLPDDAALRDLRRDEDRAHAAAELVMARYAAREISCGAGTGNVEKVQLRYILHKFPGWSKRTNLTLKGSITEIDSRWIKP